jgi:hypothetical protein
MYEVFDEVYFFGKNGSSTAGLIMQAKSSLTDQQYLVLYNCDADRKRAKFIRSSEIIGLVSMN